MHKGFTLLELLVVSVIILTLGLIVFGNYDKESLKQGYLDKCQAAGITEELCRQQFFVDYGY